MKFFLDVFDNHHYLNYVKRLKHDDMSDDDTCMEKLTHASLAN